MQIPHRPLAAAVLAAAALTPVAAQAKLPPTLTTTLIPGQQIGAVKLHMGTVKAKKAWPGDKDSCGEGGCSFADAKRPEPGSAGLYFEDAKHKKVTGITIQLGYKGTTIDFKSPMTTFTTVGGIHLGSSQKAVHRAYPKAKVVKSPGSVFFTVTDRKRNQTIFLCQHARLISIAIRDDRPRG